eukprot:TRINITY_DN2553_c0_g1_i1.p1 TRINITY_DN2553_c0_g1~~TRINITY_DN2553_c0_g1_i1.p1  ORF type:complete len:653 (-),score=158.73 TRINITY_DN2553_c0_g1_i1:38-1975(-)
MSKHTHQEYEAALRADQAEYEDDGDLEETKDESEPLVGTPPADFDAARAASTKRRIRFKKSLAANLCGIVALALVGVFVLVATVLIVTQAKPYVEQKLSDQLSFASPDAAGYHLWADNTGPDDPQITFELYVFNVENPQEAAKGQKLRLREVGPYAFKEYRVKHNVTYYDDGNIVSFYEQRYFVFDQERSAPGLLENDTFTTVNLAFQGFWANERFDNIPDIIKDALGVGLLCEAWRSGEKGYENPSVHYTPFIQAPVVGYFFGYFNDTFLMHTKSWLQFYRQEVDDLSSDFPGLSVENYTDVYDTNRRTAPSFQYTGKKDASKLGQYLKYMNMSDVYVCPLAPPSTVPGEKAACPRFQSEWTEQEATANHWVKMWKTDAAEEVQGGDCIHWPRHTGEKVRQMYVDQLFRTSYAEAQWDSEQTVPELYGIPAMQYKLRAQDMQNVTMNPEMDAYWGCGPNGFLNMTKRAGFPFFVSKPHFLDSEPWLVEAVEGLAPNRELHDTTVYISDMIGTTVGGNETMQLNAFVKNLNFSGLSCFLGDLQIVPCCDMNQTNSWDWEFRLNTSQSQTKDGLYIPIVYGRESFKLPAAVAQQIKLANTMYNTVPRYAPLVGFPVVLVCLLGLVVLLVQRFKMLKLYYWKGAVSK